MIFLLTTHYRVVPKTPRRLSFPQDFSGNLAYMFQDSSTITMTKTAGR